MKAMILSAGVGSRLEPLTIDCPKPMLPILDKPVLQYTLEWLKKYNITKIAMNLHHYPDKIKDYFKGGLNFGMDIIYSYEDVLLGTAGAIKKIADFFNEVFVVVYGDNLVNIDLQNLIEFHKNKNSKVTIGLITGLNPKYCGVVITDNENRVINFLEKPKNLDNFSGGINAGIYIVEPEILKYIPEKQFFDFGRDLFPKFLEINIPFYAYPLKGYLFDMGTPEQYRKAQFDVLKDATGFYPSGKLLKENIWYKDEIKLKKEVKLNPPLFFGKNCFISEGTTFDTNCVLSDNCLVEKGAYLKNTILGKKVSIGNASKVIDSILDDGVKLGNNVLINENVIVGKNCIIGNNVKILKDVKIWTGKVIPDKMIVDKDVK